MAIHRPGDALICRLDRAILAEPSRPQALRMRIGAAVALFLAIQVCVATWVYHHDPGRVLAPDSPSYEMSALALLVNGRFWTASGSGEPQIHRTAGYPALIAASYALFVRNPVVVIGIQLLVNCVMLALAGWIAGRVGVAAGGRQFCSLASISRFSPAPSTC
jgi:hypothetical protein